MIIFIMTPHSSSSLFLCVVNLLWCYFSSGVILLSMPGMQAFKECKDQGKLERI